MAGKDRKVRKVNKKECFSKIIGGWKIDKTDWVKKIKREKNRFVIINKTRAKKAQINMSNK